MPQPMKATNDFVVKFANVNGSGSASANQLFAKSILRMGVPVASRNIFPSNIQGLPTWFEVRVSEAGHLGRRGGVDLMVAMNPQTWDQDVKSIEPGGYLFYDSTKPMPPAKFRDDITVIGMPLTAICNEEYTDARQRQLFKNIIYVGALSALLDMDIAAVETLISEQFKGKDKLIQPNVHALHMGRDYALQHLSCPLGLTVKRADAVGNRIYIEGNSAAALGAVYGGATVCAWYPITPSSSLAEAFGRHCRRFRVDQASGKNRFAILQAEDELASIGMVIGAGWNGARAFTSTSGPGISLMQEFLGLAYFAEIPAVIFDVQRGGPSTGMPTRTQQADLLSTAFLSHGDTKHVVLLPGSVKECFELSYAAFDLAERLQTPVFVLTDLDLGMNNWMSEPFAYPDKPLDRGKVLTAEDLNRLGGFARYRDVDGDAIPWRTLPGTNHPKAAYFTRGSGHNDAAGYTEKPDEYQAVVDRLARKFETARGLVPAPVTVKNGASKIGFLAFGTTDFALRESLDQIKKEHGKDVDYMRIRAYPFAHEIHDFVASHERVYVVEQNRDAQMASLLKLDLPADQVVKLRSILNYNGLPIDARMITEEFATKEGL